MLDCPDCGQACDCDGEDHEGPVPDDCSHIALCGHADCDDELSDDDSAPYVCPGCHAVGGERCAPGCPDAAIEARHAAALDEDDDDGCPSCGGHGACGCDDSAPYDDESRACAACGGVTAHFLDCPIAALDPDADSADAAR